MTENNIKNDKIKGYIFSQGLSSLFSQKTKIDKFSTLSCSNIDNYFEYLSNAQLVYLFDYYINSGNGTELESNEKWLRRIEKVFDAKPSVQHHHSLASSMTYYSSYTTSFRASCTKFYFYSIEMLLKNKDKGSSNLQWLSDANWATIFDEFKFRIETGDDMSLHLIRNICSKFFKYNQQYAFSFMHDIKFKNLSAQIRSAYYCAFIESGLLDIKVVRRIRSDASEHTAFNAITCLLDNLQLYKNQKELMTQLVDIKHSNCQQLLANNAPDYMIPYMVAFDDSTAKAKIEYRAMNLSKTKMENANG